MRNAVSILSRRAARHLYHAHTPSTTALPSTSTAFHLLSRINAAHTPKTAHADSGDTAADEQESQAKPYIPPTPPPFPSSSSGSSAGLGLRSGRAIELAAAKERWNAAGPAIDTGSDERRTSRRVSESKGKAKNVDSSIVAEIAEPDAPAWSTLLVTLQAYPHLSIGQVRLLIHLRRHIEDTRNPAPKPGRVYERYVEVLWRQSRLHSDSGKRLSESAESLALLMRHAYRLQDVKTLKKLMDRATQRGLRRRQEIVRHGSVDGDGDGKASLRDRKREEAHGWERQGGPWIAGWPPSICPEELGMTLLVSLAARSGHWDVVNTLLLQRYPNQKSRARISPFIWGALLRHGLANASPGGVGGTVEEEEEEVAAAGGGIAGPKRKENNCLAAKGDGKAEKGRHPPASRKAERKLRAAAAAIDLNASFPHTVSPAGTTTTTSPIPKEAIDEEQLLLHQQREQQQKRVDRLESERNDANSAFLPALVTMASRQIRPRPDPADEADGEALVESDVGNGHDEMTPPSWLFLSVLNAQADRGDSAAVLSIVRSHLEATAVRLGSPEGSRSGPVHPVTQPTEGIDGTTLLNLTLRAHLSDPAVTFDGMLRVFHELTSVDLEGRIRKRPEEFKKSLRKRLEDAASQAASTSTSPSPRAPPPAEEEGGGTWSLQPNEQTLLYLLRSLPTHLFSASWSFKLVSVLTELYPSLLLTTRSYRKVLNFCLVNHKPSLSLDVLKHYRMHTTNLLHRRYDVDIDRLKLQLDRTIVGERTGKAGTGRERNEWRKTLSELVQRGWIKRSYMEKLSWVEKVVRPDREVVVREGKKKARRGKSKNLRARLAREAAEQAQKEGELDASADTMRGQGRR